MTVPGDNRTIVHMDLDTFFVSVERLGNSRLNGLPVIIGGMSDRGVVAGCSYEARTFGVHSAMPMRMARALCPDAVVIRGDMEQYTRYSNMVTTIIAEEAPVYEKASIDEHYLDITGMDRFFGSVKWSHELRQRIIRETGLPISLGLSVNKTVSKIATGQAKPNGELEIPRERVMPFLSPLSISKIPGIGEKTFHLLRSMGIANIDTLSRMPVEMVERLLGKNGIIIWKKANGIDPAPVEPYSERKSISSETTFEQDTINIGMINDLLLKKVEKLAWELRRKQKLASCVTVKVRYANFDTHTLQQRIPYTAFDHILLPVTRSLFNRLYQRRMLIRLVGVRFSHLVSGVQQISMFDDSPETISLYQAMDRIRNRFGQRAVTRAATMGTVVVEEDE
ncbi:MAG: DNA polymerase IV [Lentimicrobium sp.]|jgi:DNA polymerase-4|uniref:DNA polymerase IV n=1 Tax=Lentimicrobium sp. TaxID=2034841 RepID=UPI0025D5E347|nr:DNA polymerase IV [Lentimicrobium sp.]MCO5255270.1 DNA polymerase IV [Lentimicrobium sp.]MCO5263307.1 DNA polymerase IV [Lentimicrobium sp.]